MHPDPFELLSLASSMQYMRSQIITGLKGQEVCRGAIGLHYLKKILAITYYGCTTVLEVNQNLHCPNAN